MFVKLSVLKPIKHTFNGMHKAWTKSIEMVYHMGNIQYEDFVNKK